MKKNRSARLLPLLAALLGLLALTIPSLAGTQSDAVAIKTVDNYAGSSNVYTDQKNATITVVELDADKKPIRSWTGTTDSDGKLTIPAGHNLSKPYLKAHLSSTMAEFVSPSSLEAAMPFTFSAKGSVQGDVVQVQTVSGTVVAEAKPDDKGRVYLAAGLAAGTYFLTSGQGNASNIGTVSVKPRPQDALVRPGDVRPAPMSLQESIHPLNLNERIRLSGSGINPNAAQLDATLSNLPANAGRWAESGQALPANVLAASPNELVIASPAEMGLKPGAVQVMLEDKETGATATTEPTLAYSAKARLTQVKVPSGSETHLIVELNPPVTGGMLHAHILSGPVSFANGGNEIAIPLENGVADVAIQAKAGARGPFNAAWDIDWKGWLDDPVEKIKKGAGDWLSDPVGKTKKGLKDGLDKLRGITKALWDAANPFGKGGKRVNLGGGGTKPKDPPKDPPKAEDPKAGGDKKDPGDPKAAGDKKDPKVGGGGDTKAQEPTWEPFKDGDRKGMRKTEAIEGGTKVTEAWEDGSGERGVSIREIKVEGDTKTDTTDSTTSVGGKTSGRKRNVIETKKYKKNAKGEWEEKSHERTTTEPDGSTKTEEWVKGKGWRPKR